MEQTIYIELIVDGDVTLSVPHFSSPEALMKHAAERQTNGDGPGFMACWKDEPFKDFVPSYLLTSVMQLQYFENAPSGKKPSHPEELDDKTTNLTYRRNGEADIQAIAPLKTDAPRGSVEPTLLTQESPWTVRCAPTVSKRGFDDGVTGDRVVLTKENHSVGIANNNEESPEIMVSDAVQP